jgi:hypothetical protein
MSRLPAGDHGCLDVIDEAASSLQAIPYRIAHEPDIHQHRFHHLFRVGRTDPDFYRIQGLRHVELTVPGMTFVFIVICLFIPLQVKQAGKSA